MNEDALEKNIFNQQSEKSFIDKILAKNEVEREKELISTPHLGREKLLELLYLLAGNESKLVNYSDWTRYIALKYFVWIREFVKVAELLYDVKDDFTKKTSMCKKCRKFFKQYEKNIVSCECENPVPLIKVSHRSWQMLYNIERMTEHNAKFLIDLYFNMARTSLSLGATGIFEILRNKYEISYPEQARQPEKSAFGFKKA